MKDSSAAAPSAQPKESEMDRAIREGRPVAYRRLAGWKG